MPPSQLGWWCVAVNVEGSITGPMVISEQSARRTADHLERLIDLPDLVIEVSKNEGFGIKLWIGWKGR